MKKKITIIVDACDICGRHEPSTILQCDICHKDVCVDHRETSDEDVLVLCDECLEKGYRFNELENGPVIKLGRKIILRW